MLYIVATPIGNLEDITLRAMRILSEVDVICAEDTRVIRKLIESLENDTRFSIFDLRINARLVSYHQHSGEDKKLEILNMLLQDKSIALVTDAGTPGVSDPGNELISFILENNSDVNVVPIPGPSAITTALSVSGMNVNKFVFLGFLPKKKRQKLFKWLKEGKVPFAFYESPNRILKTLDVFEKEFGGSTEIFIARELTKLHETLYRGTIINVIEQLQKDKTKGEIVVVVKL